VRPPPVIDTHVIDLYPPDERRDTWMIVCSFKDLSRQFLNRSDAVIAAYDHFNGLMIMEELERGTYRFKEKGIVE
jgi:hypothetical protein